MNATIEPISRADARRLLGLLDLTLLDERADIVALERLVATAASPLGRPAALCVWPHHVRAAGDQLERHGITDLPIATVVNFPDGGIELLPVEREIQAALAAGASEIDAVLPYRALRTGALHRCQQMLLLFRRASGDALLKVILETGELTPTEIAEASRMAIDAGADFIKTSTGKSAVHATPAAARTMLEAICERGGRCGFKAAGGIRSAGTARDYLQLAEQMLGTNWPTAARFRIGASALVAELHGVLAADAPA